MIVHISKILEEKAQDIPAISSAYIEAKVFNAWWKIALGKVMQNSAPDKFIAGTLYLKTKTSVWAQELSSLKTAMLEKVNNLLGQEVVLDMKFKPGMAVWQQEKEEEKKKCPDCETEYTGSSKLCSFCERAETEKIKKKIYEALNKTPSLTYDKLGQIKHQINEEAFHKVKRETKNRILDRLIEGKKDMDKDKWEKLFNQYIELLLGKAINEIKETDVKGVRKAVQNKINNYSRRRKLR